MAKLSRLKKLNPLPTDLDEIKRYGFMSDISIGSKWITDGHAIFWRAGFDESLLINKSEHGGWKPLPGGIASMWAEAQAREDVGVAILGSMDRLYGEFDFRDEWVPPSERAILRDECDRLIFVDAFKLAFMLFSLNPDAISVAKKDAPLAWLRFSLDGNLVGCLMPMLGGGGIEGYDLDGEALPLEITINALTKA